MVQGGQTESNRVKQGHIGPIGANESKWVLTGPNGPRQGQMGSNRVKQGLHLMGTN